jgi:hypothetical protein
MKKSLVLLAAMAMVGFAQADILSDNGLASGFESYYINEWNEKIPDGFSNWTQNWGAAGISHGVITDDPAGAHGGSFYWHLNGPDNGNPLVGTVFVTQDDGMDAAVNPGDSMTFGAWVKNDAADPANFIEFGFDRFGPTPWGWGWQGNLGLMSIDTLTTEWQYFEVTAVVPTACDVVSPKVATFGGTIYTDDWTMARVLEVDDRTLYVDVDAPGSNDGSSWHNAFNHLQDALSLAANGNSIWVAEGSYRPDQGTQQTPGDRNASFELKDGVQIKGGFAGYGTADPNQNDPELYPVVLSGDLQGDDGLDFINNNDNSYHVVTGSNVTASASLEGVVVTGGNADGEFDITEGLVSYWQFNESQGSVAYDSISTNHGTVYGAERTVGLIDGALRFDGVDDYVFVTDSPSLDVSEGITIGMWIKPDYGMNCNGNNNWRYLLRKGNYGWGAYNVIYEASFHIPLVGFRVDAGGSIHGLWTTTAANPNEFVHLVFKYNATTGRQKTYINGQLDSQSITAGGPISENIGPLKIGGGENIANCPDGAGGFKGLIDDVVIYDRPLSAQEIQGLFNITNDGRKAGGGMYNLSSDPKVINCAFRGNYAKLGGGMYNNSSNPIVTNCSFSSNTAYDDGSVMVNLNNSSPTVTNCTFSGNEAYDEGATMVNSYNSNPTVTNSIFWGNTTPDGNEIYNLESEPLVSYCDVKGGCVGIGNIDSDPLFVDADNDNFTLHPDSPCIDAADNNSVPTDITDVDGDGNTDEILPWDIVGNPRFIDQPEVADIGNGTVPIVDMGCFEANYLQTAMKLTPRTLNCRSRGNWVNWVKAHFTLPTGITVSDIDPDKLSMVYPLGIEAEFIEIYLNEDGFVEVTAAFDREVACSVMGEWPDMLTVFGFLNDDSIFYGQSGIRINPAGLKEIETLARHWLRAGCGPPKWCDGIDLNRDSIVDLQDYSLLLNSEVEFTTE